VDFNPADGHFECPCHKSAFAKDGAQLYGPSRRGLDSLPVRLETKGDQTEVQVAFQNFEAAIPERKPVG
jgi:Rieske Fe-S protein